MNPSDYFSFYGIGVPVITKSGVAGKIACIYETTLEIRFTNYPPVFSSILPMHEVTLLLRPIQSINDDDIMALYDQPCFILNRGRFIHSCLIEDEDDTAKPITDLLCDAEEADMENVLTFDRVAQSFVYGGMGDEYQAIGICHYSGIINKLRKRGVDCDDLIKKSIAREKQTY